MENQTEARFINLNKNRYYEISINSTTSTWELHIRHGGIYNKHDKHKVLIFRGETEARNEIKKIKDKRIKRGYKLV